MLDIPRETKEARDRRLKLRKRAQWAHVKKGKGDHISFEEFWRGSKYHDASAYPGMGRKQRRAAAKDLWRAQKKIRTRAAVNRG